MSPRYVQVITKLKLTKARNGYQCINSSRITGAWLNVDGTYRGKTAVYGCDNNYVSAWLLLKGDQIKFVNRLR